ncbi:MAG: sarcosine oxidase subunit gamma family protein [Pseudomonadota bacterium]
MSEPLGALAGAVADGLARCEAAGPRGMVTLKGDLSAAPLKEAATGVTGVAFPDPLDIHLAGENGLAWMAPDEVLLLVPHAEADAAAQALGDALSGAHHLAVNVSDARALITVSGPAAREVLAKLTPVDLHGFSPGQIRRTRLAQVSAAFWMRDAETFEIVCFRSVAVYVFDVLTEAARQGSRVGYF